MAAVCKRKAGYASIEIETIACCKCPIERNYLGMRNTEYG